jgi:chorismate synthase
MASNSFGQLFRITTWGESHGPAIGVVIDGCPAGLALDASDIEQELRLRAPGQTPWTTPRSEPDDIQILSGVFEGVTTGTPISIIIYNRDVDSSKYEPIKSLIRPGHAQYTYLAKYGSYDYRGGGRASARETACRVAAGAIAKKILYREKIEVRAYLSQVGMLHSIHHDLKKSDIFCVDQQFEHNVKTLLTQLQLQGESVGGTVSFEVTGLQVGLGDPIYEKLEAKLAQAMLSIPATKGFEIGEGFRAAQMQGSTHNDAFISLDGVTQKTNHAGGILGGISTGMPIIGRVAFKPTSSISLPQDTIDVNGNPQLFQLPSGSRHDPCVAIRGVAVVRAMCYLVLVDAMLANRLVRLS